MWMHHLAQIARESGVPIVQIDLELTGSTDVFLPDRSGIQLRMPHA